MGARCMEKAANVHAAKMDNEDRMRSYVEQGNFILPRTYWMRRAQSITYKLISEGFLESSLVQLRAIQFLRPPYIHMFSTFSYFISTSSFLVNFATPTYHQP